MEDDAMRAVIAVIPPETLAWRKRTGNDKFDEMWEGVLHMPPMPNRTHQELEGALERWLWTYWAQPRGAKVYHQINIASIGGWPDDYRIPDLVLLTPDRFHVDHDEYFEGAPTVVVEIHGPGDEAHDKMPFYAKLGVPEMWIIDRGAKEPEVYVLKRGRYAKQAADAEGWIPSAATGVELRAETGQKLALRLPDDPDTLRLVPES